MSESVAPANWLLAQHQVVTRLISDQGYGALGVMVRRVSDKMQTSSPTSVDDLKLERDPNRCLHALTFIISGQAEYIDYKQQRSHVSAGDLVHLFRPDEKPRPPEPDMCKRSTDFLECSLYILGVHAQELHDLGVFESFKTISQVRNSQQIIEAYTLLFRQLLLQKHQGENIRKLICCIHAIQGQVINSNDHRNDWLSQSYELLKRKTSTKNSVQDVADEIGMSYRQFREQFKKHTGMAPVRYQIQQRMQHACDLLRNYNVAQVAQRLGYDNVPQFSRQFSSEIGMSPKKYQSRNKSYE